MGWVWKILLLDDVKAALLVRAISKIFWKK